MLALTAALLAPSPTVADESAFTRVRTPAGFPVQFEIIRDAAGPLAARIRNAGGDWRLPRGDAVLLDEDWWTPLRPLGTDETSGLRSTPSRRLIRRVRERIAPAATPRLPDRLTAASLGDVTEDGQTDLVLSFRRPFKHNFINVTRPRRMWADEYGLSAHVGLYRPEDLSEIWVAGTLVRPVTSVEACDGALAVAYGKLNRPGIVETGAWRWAVFGFLPTEPLPGPGVPACVDIDGDGRTEPAILERSVP